MLAGEIVAGQLVKLACERHEGDWARQGTATFPYRFDADRAAKAIRFFDNLKHYKGIWNNQPFHLEPWQEFIVGSLFGWVRADDSRRYRIAYVEVARKNGKSFMAAGLALLLAFFDGEPGSEVYTAATKRDQAKIVWDACKQIVQRTPGLRARIQTYRENLNVPATACKLEPLGADADTMDGLNPHGVVIDELHAHKSSAVVDVMETATGARRQPLQVEITTAGFDRASICWKHHEYSRQVLEGVVSDETWFGFIAGLDAEDDWRDPAVWAKANPNLGVSVQAEELAEKCHKAQHLPAAQNAFKRLRLDVWTDAAEVWIDDDVWMRGRATVDPDDLIGRPCYAGLDLASSKDVAAFVLLFPDDAGGYDVWPSFWVPAEGASERTRRDGAKYTEWIDAELMTPTPGNVIDYDAIHERIRELAETYEIREIAYDRWGATQLITQLQGDGLECVPLGQGFASMSAPTKELEKIVLGGRLRHGGHPVLRWMVANTVVELDAAGNIKPSKKRSKDKIDGVVALVMALDRATRQPLEQTSGYDEDGIFIA